MIVASLKRIEKSAMDMLNCILAARATMGGRSAGTEKFALMVFHEESRSRCNRKPGGRLAAQRDRRRIHEFYGGEIAPGSLVKIVLWMRSHGRSRDPPARKPVSALPLPMFSCQN